MSHQHQQCPRHATFGVLAHSVQNPYLWQRYQVQRRVQEACSVKPTTTAPSTATVSPCEDWLWHPTAVDDAVTVACGTSGVSMVCACGMARMCACVCVSMHVRVAWHAALLVASDTALHIPTFRHTPSTPRPPPQTCNTSLAMRRTFWTPPSSRSPPLRSCHRANRHTANSSWHASPLAA